MIDFVANSNLIKYTEDFGFSKILTLKEIKSVEGRNENITRKALEDKKTDLIYGIEKYTGRDKLNQKNSGLNQVLCRLARENKVKIGLSFNDLLNSDGAKRAVILGRMVQNAMLCNKYKVDVVVGSFANNKHELRMAKDLIAFGRLLGLKKIWNEKIDNFYKDEDILIRRVK